MILWYGVWIGSLFLSTIVSSYYVRTEESADAAIALYCVYLALSQILAAKVGIFKLGIKLIAPGASMLYPFLYQLNDMVNEYFGESKTHKMILIAFTTQVFMIMALILSIRLPPARENFPQTVWENLLWSGIRITGSSWIAFLITNNLDAWIYPRIKKLTEGKHLWLRSAGSDAITLTLDSLIFVPLAFIEFPISFQFLLSMIIGQTITKYFFGLIDTPFLYLTREIVGNVESLDYTR